MFLFLKIKIKMYKGVILIFCSNDFQVPILMFSSWQALSNYVREGRKERKEEIREEGRLLLKHWK